MSDKELIQTPVSRPNACTVRAENTAENTLQMLPGTNRSIRAASEGNTHTPSTLRCVTACSHSTSATRLQGKIDKMHQQHRYGQLQYIIYVCGIWGNSLFTALLRQFNVSVSFHQCGRTFKNKANAKSSVCVLIKFKFPWGAVRDAEGEYKNNNPYLVYFFQSLPLLLL